MRSRSLTYTLNKNSSLTGSYVCQRERIADRIHANENRLHVQTTFSYLLKRINIKHRLRMDNRYVTNPSIGENDYKPGFRLLFGMILPFNSDKDNLYFTAYEEGFLIPLRMQIKSLEKIGALLPWVVKSTAITVWKPDRFTLYGIQKTTIGLIIFIFKSHGTTISI